MTSPRPTAGFTLIELLLTLAVAAILLSLAVPGLTDFIRASRAEVQASAVVDTLQLARAEAVRRSDSVQVTPVVAGSRWQGGWRVWVDRNGNDVFDSASDLELQRLSAFTGAAELTSGDDTRVVFDRLGNALGVAAGEQVRFQYRIPGHCRLGRDITVNHLGRVTTRRETCP